MTARSCVIQISAVPDSRAKRLHLGEDLRLDGDVERGGRLVGDQEQRPVQQRNRDRDPLAHAAGELVRIGVQPLVAATRCRRPRARRARAPRAARCDTRSCAVMASIIWVSMRSTGLSVIIGSWKIMAMLRPR